MSSTRAASGNRAIAGAPPFDSMEAGPGNAERPGHDLDWIVSLICAHDPEDLGDVTSFRANQASPVVS